MGRGKLVICALALALAAPSGAAAQSYPYDPDQDPPGANDFSCRPSAEHPDPVVLVHGLGANMAQNWGYIAPALAGDGYCVFALTYGRKLDNPPPFDQPGGLVYMEESALELKAFIERVLAATGAARVDIVGHSEGSLMPNYYVKFLDSGADVPTVDDYVGLTPLWDGTNVALAGDMSDYGRPYGFTDRVYEYFEEGCESCTSFIKGSEFLQKMNEGPTGPRVEGVTYTMVMTRYDELVVPYDSGYMEGATNYVLQEQCEADPSEHMAVAFNPLTLAIIRNALDPAAGEAVDCTAYPNGF